MPIVIAFRKSRRAQDKEDYETWVESDTATTSSGGLNEHIPCVIIKGCWTVIYEVDRHDSRPPDTKSE